MLSKLYLDLVDNMLKGLFGLKLPYVILLELDTFVKMKANVGRADCWMGLQDMYRLIMLTQYSASQETSSCTASALLLKTSCDYQYPS